MRLRHSAFLVPEGRPAIAQHFELGRMHNVIASPVGTAESFAASDSAVPTGLVEAWSLVPSTEGAGLLSKAADGAEDLSCANLIRFNLASPSEDQPAS